MKRTRTLCAAALLVSGVLLSPAAAVIRIGVDRFRSGAPGVSPDVADAVTEMFITQLSNSGSFQVYERTALEKVAREQRLSMSGLVSESTLVKVGRLAGVEWIITGAVTQFDEKQTGGVLPIHGFGLAVGTNVGTVTLDVRTIDTTTGAITAALRKTGAASRAIAGAVYEGTVIGTTQYGGVGSQAAMK
ncbi:CsgG/HfaB family protein, partial [Pyramidobacter porci]